MLFTFVWQCLHPSSIAYSSPLPLSATPPTSPLSTSTSPSSNSTTTITTALSPPHPLHHHHHPSTPEAKPNSKPSSKHGSKTSNPGSLRPMSSTPFGPNPTQTSLSTSSAGLPYNVATLTPTPPTSPSSKSSSPTSATASPRPSSKRYSLVLVTLTFLFITTLSSSVVIKDRSLIEPLMFIRKCIIPRIANPIYRLIPCCLTCCLEGSISWMFVICICNRLSRCRSKWRLRVWFRILMCWIWL